jgi:MFS family permease
MVAVAYQVYALTRSSLAVGLVSLAQLLPLIAGALLGGSLADAADRRRVLLVAQLLTLLCSAGLAVNADTGPALWPLFALPAVAAGFTATTESGLSAILPNLVPRGEVATVNAMVFGMPRAVFPALATTVFGGGASTLGFLYAAPGAGALVGAVTTGWVRRVRRQGRAVIIAVLVWGAAITCFGLVRWLPAALVLLAVAGWADVISAVFRSTILQLNVPDALRGRLMGVQMAVVTGGPRIGDAESGAVAAAFSPVTSVISGGLACIGGALLLARLLPAFRRQEVAAAAPVAARPGPAAEAA